jgi:hypothetical protein
VPFADVVYAEDGSQFYEQARTLGLSAIWEPAAGYLHLAPRLGSALIALLPVSTVAAAYAVSATVLVSVLALYVFHASTALLVSWQSRAILAGAMIVPSLAGQTIANLTNLHWYLMFAAFWAVVFKPRTLAWAVGGAVVGAAAALSDPLTALLLPTAAVAIYRYRSWLHFIVVGAVLAGLAIQSFVVIGAEQRVGTEASWADLPIIYAFRVAGGLVFGDVHLGGLWERAGSSVAVVAIVAVTIVVAGAFVGATGWRLAICALAVANSLLFLAVPTLLRGTASLVPVADQPPPLHSGRYMLIPALLIVVCIAELVDRAAIDRTRSSVIMGGVTAVWLALVIVGNFLITPHVDGPSWKAGIEAASVECRSSTSASATVAIAPAGRWKVSIQCEDL